MNRCPFLDWADDAVDGVLSEARAAEFAAHTKTCPDCRQAAVELKRLIEAAQSLPPALTPPHDLWPAIADRLPRRVAPSRTWTRWLGLAAAAAVLVITTAVLTALLVKNPPPENQNTNQAFNLLLASDNDYQRAEAELTRVFEKCRPRLAPETIQTVERNLKLIDRSLAETRSALERDPASRNVLETYQKLRRKKLEVLETTARLSEKI